MLNSKHFYSDSIHSVDQDPEGQASPRRTQPVTATRSEIFKLRILKERNKTVEREQETQKISKMNFPVAVSFLKSKKSNLPTGSLKELSSDSDSFLRSSNVQVRQAMLQTGLDLKSNRSNCKPVLQPKTEQQNAYAAESKTAHID